ncbi:MAG: hypothetical protein LBT04_06230 [Prevotellaceae bacterium]|nr:hypothetical protein [Prevotellaceae bacterium]
MTQNVFADETAGASSVSITTAGAWTSSITEAGSQTAPQAIKLKATTASLSWVLISPDHGDSAGNYIINISLSPNTTGADRTAVITISCEGSELPLALRKRERKRTELCPQT